MELERVYELSDATGIITRIQLKNVNRIALTVLGKRCLVSAEFVAALLVAMNKDGEVRMEVLRYLAPQLPDLAVRGDLPTES